MMSVVPMASVAVNSSARKIAARTMVMSREMVEIIEVACGEVRARPALMRKEGSTVAKKAQPATRPI